MIASVVVPVYNAEKTLHRFLSSLAAQTHSELEVILVDDGSTDASEGICRRWAEQDHRFRVISQENRGPGAARNTGMDAASGEIIFFFDSDDEVCSDLVEQVLRRFQETNAQAVLYGCSHIHENGTVVQWPLKTPKPQFSGREIREQLLPGLFTYRFGAGVSPWGKGYDLTFLRNNHLRFPEERDQVCEDGQFMLELFSKTACAAVLPACLYSYYHRPESLSRRFRPDRQQQNNMFLQRCTEFVRLQSLPEETVAHIRSRYHGMTLGTMGAVLSSDLPQREKSRQLRRILHDPVLESTLRWDVMKLDAPLPRLFWCSLKWRQYGLCRLLLWANRLRRGTGI